MTKTIPITTYSLTVGRIFYKHGDTVIEEYEGEFEAGQYHGTGKLVDLNGEIFEGTFLENKFKDK